MTEKELIELAKAYVAMSNAHQLNLLTAMFGPQSVYRSSSVGEFIGQAAIIEMMAGFFARYPDVHWHSRNYACRDFRVSFDFTMQASESGSNTPLERSGVETIEFDPEGTITSLTVEIIDGDKR
jgi:hypothetical protein